MDGSFEQQIRRRAYELWVQGGMPDGHDRDHWHKAEREIMMIHEHEVPAKPARAPSRKVGIAKDAGPKIAAKRGASAAKTPAKKVAPRVAAASA